MNYTPPKLSQLAATDPRVHAALLDVCRLQQMRIDELERELALDTCEHSPVAHEHDVYDRLIWRCSKCNRRVSPFWRAVRPA